MPSFRLYPTRPRAGNDFRGTGFGRKQVGRAGQNVGVTRIRSRRGERIASLLGDERSGRKGPDARKNWQHPTHFSMEGRPHRS